MGKNTVFKCTSFLSTQAIHHRNSIMPLLAGKIHKGWIICFMSLLIIPAICSVSMIVFQCWAFSCPERLCGCCLNGYCAAAVHRLQWDCNNNSITTFSFLPGPSQSCWTYKHPDLWITLSWSYLHFRLNLAADASRSIFQDVLFVVWGARLPQ